MLQFLCHPNFIKLNLSMFGVSLFALNRWLSCCLTNHLDHFVEYWYLYLSEIGMCHLQIEGASLWVMRYANHLHTIGILRRLRHYLGGHHMRLCENQKGTVLFLLLVVYVRGKIEIIPEQYLIHHNNPTSKISWFTLPNAFEKSWKM